MALRHTHSTYDDRVQVDVMRTYDDGVKGDVTSADDDRVKDDVLSKDDDGAKDDVTSTAKVRVKYDVTNRGRQIERSMTRELHFLHRLDAQDAECSADGARHGLTQQESRHVDLDDLTCNTQTTLTHTDFFAVCHTTGAHSFLTYI